jgi:hypothetical protein
VYDEGVNQALGDSLTEPPPAIRVLECEHNRQDRVGPVGSPRRRPNKVSHDLVTLFAARLQSTDAARTRVDERRRGSLRLTNRCFGRAYFARNLGATCL